GGKGMKIEKYVVPFCKRLMACGNCIDTNNHRAFSRFRIYLHEKYGLDEDLEGKRFSQVSEPYFILQQRVLDRLLLAVLREIDVIS
ncbi:hypothetical protein, partial [Pontibacterium sp.]|uniref:hypothetical protein n=1 Tax=Pontibacterium sp. TaxID=2036026 RepID=UPI003516CDED